jgi:hypothetical protein
MTVRRDADAEYAHTPPVQTPEPLGPPPPEPEGYPPPRTLPGNPLFWGLGERLAWVSGLVLALSSFTGWHTGTIGKLVFFIGLAILVLAVLRESGIDLPATVPESLVVIALGSLATIFALVRLISIPDEFFFAGRAVGIWITFAAAIGLIVGGLLEASEEL